MLVLIILSILTILTFCFSVAGRLVGNVQIHFELIIIYPNMCSQRDGCFLGKSRLTVWVGCFRGFPGYTLLISRVMLVIPKGTRAF